MLLSYGLTGCCSFTGLQGAAVSLAVLLAHRMMQFYWQFYWLQGAAVLLAYRVLQFYWLTGCCSLNDLQGASVLLAYVCCSFTGLQACSATVLRDYSGLAEARSRNADRIEGGENERAARA